MSIFDYIAFNDGSLGTVWGPCSDGTKISCDCPQCTHANRIEESGKDYSTEYELARLRNFDRD